MRKNKRLKAMMRFVILTINVLKHLISIVKHVYDFNTVLLSINLFYFFSFTTDMQCILQVKLAQTFNLW